MVKEAHMLWVGEFLIDLDRRTPSYICPRRLLQSYCGQESCQQMESSLRRSLWYLCEGVNEVNAPYFVRLSSGSTTLKWGPEKWNRHLRKTGLSLVLRSLTSFPTISRLGKIQDPVKLPKSICDIVAKFLPTCTTMRWLERSVGGLTIARGWPGGELETTLKRGQELGNTSFV